MMKSSFSRRWFVLVLMAVGMLVLGSCTQRGTAVEPIRSPTAPFTLTSSPTAIPTATPTVTPQPTLTPTYLPVSPIPAGPKLKDLPIISLENVAELAPVASVELNEGDQVTWSPSGDAFAVSSPSGMKVYRLGLFSAPISIRYQSLPYFSADGAFLATRLENGDVQVWDLELGALQAELSGMLGEVVHMAFSSTNDLLAAVSINNQVLVWDLASGEISARLEVPEFVIPITYTYDLLFSPDQTQLALFREGEVLLWEIHESVEPRRLHWLPSPASPVHGPYQFSPDWSTIAWSDRGNIMIMDTASGEQLNEFERQVGTHFTITQDWGSLVAIGYNDTVVSVWDPFSAQALFLLEHPETVLHFWLSPDERYLGSLTFEGRATLWDLTTGEELAELTNEEARGDWLAFSPSGDQLALLFNDGRIGVWDVAAGVQKFTLDNMATRTFLFSPDGSLLVTLSPLGGLQIWNTTVDDEMLAKDLPGGNVDISPSFIYDGRLLAIETARELQLWGIE
jgi:WD40 repeat protein